MQCTFWKIFEDSDRFGVGGVKLTIWRLGIIRSQKATPWTFILHFAVSKWAIPLKIWIVTPESRIAEFFHGYHPTEKAVPYPWLHEPSYEGGRSRRCHIHDFETPHSFIDHSVGYLRDMKYHAIEYSARGPSEVSEKPFEISGDAAYGDNQDSETCCSSEGYVVKLFGGVIN
jgi:hypothetical protein